MARIAGRGTEQLDHPFRWAELVHAQDRDAYRGAHCGSCSSPVPSSS
jgi:hypothetical protein